MVEPRLSGQARQRLVALLGDDRPEPNRLMERLAALRRLERVPACAETLRLLANIRLGEPQAEKLLQDILEHREVITRVLGRDPGIRVAAVDFLHNVEGMLKNPTIIELSQFEETQRSAVTDALTGLYNRRYFRSSIHRELRRSRRYDLEFSLLMLDLDDFKTVNDEFGHVVGDQVLRKVGRTIRKLVREADVACRYGGEEFTVITPETNRLGTYTVAERIRRGIEEALGGESDGGRKVTISGGIASFPEDGSDLTVLMRRVDDTLYLAKKAGKNRIVLHPSERRRSVRYPASPLSTVEIQRSSDPALRRALGINFSRYGALLEADGPFRLADPVGLCLGGAGTAIEGDPLIQGLVVRVEPEPVAPQRVRIGVAFKQPIAERVLREQVLRGYSWRTAGGGRS